MCRPRILLCIFVPPPQKKNIACNITNLKAIHSSEIFPPDECPDLCWPPFSEENWKKASFPVFYYIMFFFIFWNPRAFPQSHTLSLGNYGRTRRLINIFAYSIRIHNLVNVSVRKSPQKLINSSMHKESKNQDTQSH